MKYLEGMHNELTTCFNKECFNIYKSSHIYSYHKIKNRPASYRALGLLLALQLGIVAIMQAGRDGLWGKLLQLGNRAIWGGSSSSLVNAAAGPSGEGAVGLRTAPSSVRDESMSCQGMG